jgi:hypothetical protein
MDDMSFTPREKNCPGCGAGFTCAHNSSCWCVAYFIPDALRTELRKKYSGCLCSDCLLQYGAVKSGNNFEKMN